MQQEMTLCVLACKHACVVRVKSIPVKQVSLSSDVWSRRTVLSVGYF